MPILWWIIFGPILAFGCLLFVCTLLDRLGIFDWFDARERTRLDKLNCPTCNGVPVILLYPEELGALCSEHKERNQRIRDLEDRINKNTDFIN